MANRYANLVGSNKIKDEWQKINTGFDLVQADMDAKPDSSIAQVNDIELDADDTLTIEGGTGITVTTIPEQKKMRIVATGTSTPGPRAIEHITGGSDVIPNATTSVSGLMSAVDKAKLDAATSAATPNTIVQRDPAGRFKAGAPSEADDVARKGELDNLNALVNMRLLGRFEIQDVGETPISVISTSLTENQIVFIHLSCPRNDSPQNPANAVVIPCVIQERTNYAKYFAPLTTALADGSITNLTDRSFTVTLNRNTGGPVSYVISHHLSGTNIYVASASGTISGKTVVSVSASNFVR